MNTKENLFFYCFTAKMLIISLQFDLYAETSLPKKKSFFCSKATKPPADVPPKAEKRKQKQLASIGEGY